MGWIEVLHGHVVGLDTAPLIYYIEEHPAYLSVVDPFFDAIARGNVQVATSTVTLVEVLTQPLRQRNYELAARYRHLLTATRGLVIHAVSPAIAEEAARLRADSSLRTPDAIQLATAIMTGADAFLTNDARLPAIPGLRLLVLDRIRSSS